MSALRNQFPQAFIAGCLFHFLQALKHKLRELEMDPMQIDIEISPDVLDLLIITLKS